MPHATLPPPPDAPSADRAVETPHLPVRAPLSRARPAGGTGRITRRGVALSVGLHLLLALGVWLAPVRPHRDAPPVPSGPPTEVGFMDIGAWPTPGQGAAGEVVTAAPVGGAAGGPVAAEPGEAGASAATAAPRADTVSVRTRAAQPEVGRFPQRAPAGIPGARVGAGQTARASAGAPQGRGEAGGAAVGGSGTGAGRAGPMGGRLSTEYGDGRLVVRPQAVPERPLTDRERLNARISARIGVINDSILDAERRAHRAQNWTVKDRNGREWGIARGGQPVVAGVKLPVSLQPPGGRSRESELYDRERTRQRDELDRQSAGQAADDNLRERTRATRERVDRERRERREQEATKP